MSEKHSYTANEKAQYLFDEYARIIREVFPGVVFLDEFFESFNRFFSQYQDSNKRKMLPSSIREGKVSCSSAAALTGIWWYIVQSVEPTYFVEQVSRDSQCSKSGAHVVVGLPILEKQNNVEEIDDAYSARMQGVKLPEISIVDYTIKHGLAHAHPRMISQPVERLHRNVPYLLNRVHTLGIRSKDISIDKN
jgi:hypothetical protein